MRDGTRAQIAVTVEKGRIHRLEMEPPALEITAGEEQRFAARAFDAEDNEVALRPVWAVSNGIGQINEEGVFRALRAGRGFVSAQTGPLTALAPVGVSPGAVARIDLDPSEAVLHAGGGRQFQGQGFRCPGQ